MGEPGVPPCSKRAAAEATATTSHDFLQRWRERQPGSSHVARKNTKAELKGTKGQAPRAPAAATLSSETSAILPALRQGRLFALAQACPRSLSWPVPAVHVRA